MKDAICGEKFETEKLNRNIIGMQRIFVAKNVEKLIK